MSKIGIFNQNFTTINPGEGRGGKVTQKMFQSGSANSLKKKS